MSILNQHEINDCHQMQWLLRVDIKVTDLGYLGAELTQYIGDL